MKKFDIPFGITAVAIGGFLLYAAWANPPLAASTACGTSITTPQMVRFSPAFTLEYYNHCGGALDFQLLFLLGFTVVGIILIVGGGKSLKHIVN